MKAPAYIAILFFSLFGLSQKSEGQYTAEMIAVRIAMDSGGSMADYMDYSRDLATLLSTYSPDALKRIMGASYVEAPSLNDTLGLSPINFPYASSALSGEAKAELDKVFDFLQENPDLTITIEGHTSKSYRGDLKLSETRAAAAKLYLASKGIDSMRIESSGKGFSEPLTEDAFDEANQRIEIRVAN